MIDLIKILSNKKCDEILSKLADNTLVIKEYFPELLALKGVDDVDGTTHKDNYIHTLQVLKQVSEKTDNIKIKLIALFHDIGKQKLNNMLMINGLFIIMNMLVIL